MDILYGFGLFLSGLISGVLGGMGMGGGTVLIPVLTIFMGIKQHEAQAFNLISFIPMAAVSLFIHAKNGRVEKKGLLWIIIPAIVFSALGGALSFLADEEFLKRFFGGFLCALSVLEFFSQNLNGKNENNNRLIVKNM